MPAPAPAPLAPAPSVSAESNPVSVKDPSKGSVRVFSGSPYVADLQPRHGYAPYQHKFDIVNGTPRMDGFVDYERSQHPLQPKKADSVMQGFAQGDCASQGFTSAGIRGLLGLPLGSPDSSQLRVH